MPLADGPHLDLLREAIAVEGRAQRALLEGDETSAADAFLEASRLYRESWELASPTAFGRLIGMLKAAVIAGDASAAAAYARTQIPDPPESAPSSYALAIAALVEGDEGTARAASAGMRSGSPPFLRAADAIDGLLDRDTVRYAAAIRAIVADFEGREEYLTGVPIADTALMFERLAVARGMACAPESPLLPAGG
ncbi:MAG: hypothetical protein QOJ25_1903 [Solirubrobacteraceae bacterium]|jgi:hypothetical protein|nr:hypothetical protein [Solirubrobacteraceae bacterium]